MMDERTLSGATASEAAVAAEAAEAAEAGAVEEAEAAVAGTVSEAAVATTGAAVAEAAGATVAGAGTVERTVGVATGFFFFVEYPQEKGLLQLVRVRLILAAFSKEVMALFITL